MASGMFDFQRQLALFIMVVGGIFYLGGSTARGIIENDLVEIGTLKFRQDIPFDAEKEIYNLLARISLLVVFGYLLAFMGFCDFHFQIEIENERTSECFDGDDSVCDFYSD